MKVVYVNGEYRPEEEKLREYGIQCERIAYPGGKVNSMDRILFRGPKMNSRSYSIFLDEVGPVLPVASVDDYMKVADALEYSKCFGKYSPKVIDFHIDTSIDEIAEALKGASFPLFVRSNVESAAKYVGVEACILKDVDGIETVLKPIKEHIKTAERIIMKEVVPIKKINGINTEYRAIVITDKLVCFDYDSSCGLPDPYKFPYEAIINTASTNGLHGAYFLDLGVSEDDALFVVECKNLFNGTIKNISSFAEGLLKC